MKGTEIHHRIPKSLLKLYDICFNSDLDYADPLTLNKPTTALAQALITFDEECSRYGINGREISRGMLEMQIKDSEVQISKQQHRRQEHAEDWKRWGRKGGLRTLQLYGTDHFRELARKRWRKEHS